MIQHNLDALQAALNDHQGPTFVISVEQLQGIIARLRKAEADAALYREYYEADQAYTTLHDQISPGLSTPTEDHYKALGEATRRFGKARDAIHEKIKARKVAAPSDSGREGARCISCGVVAGGYHQQDCLYSGQVSADSAGSGE